MNNNFSVPSLETIKKQLHNQDLEFIEIFDWGQESPWKECIEASELKNGLPRYIIVPNTKKMLSQFLKICCKNKWRILPLGNGSKLHWGKLPSGARVLVSTHKLNKIIEHAQDDLTITIQSGMKIKDLQDFLASFNQFLPIDPIYPQFATVGGVVATANTGSLRQRYGGVRDLILGISFCRSDGEEAKAGGKVVKNVAGYDLMKLFTGSYGNLAIITEVTFRLFPVPSDSITLLLTGNQEKIGQLQKKICASALTPTSADLLSESLINGLNLDFSLGLALRFQGIEESVSQQSARVKQWAEDIGLFIHQWDSEKELDLWTRLKDMVFQGANNRGIICKVGILPTKITELFALTQGYGFVNMGTGVGYVCLPKGIKNHQVRGIRNFCQDNEGYLTVLESGASTIKQEIEPWGYVGNGLEMMKKIKSNFDPFNIFVDRL